MFTGARSPEAVHPIARELGAAGYLYQPYAPSLLVAARDAAVSGGVYYPAYGAAAPLGRLGLLASCLLGTGLLTLLGLGSLWSRLRKAMRIRG